MGARDTKGRPRMRAAPLFSRASRGEFERPEKNGGGGQRGQGGDPGRRPPPPARSLLAGSYSVQALLLAQHQEPSLVREQAITLHIVDQGGDERARRADQVGQVLLGDPVQAELV